LALLELPASKALVPLPQQNFQKPDNDLCHAPGFFISGTKLFHATRAELFYLSSDFAFLDKGSKTVHEFAEPPY